MMAGPTTIRHDPEVLPALRELFSQHSTTEASGAEVLSDLLYELRYLPYRPEPFAVEAAREAILIEDKVLS
jgi:hypothetical protein